MEEEYKNYPFYDWVPKPLGIIFMIILFVPMITMSGVYSANSGEMMSGLGIQSEYIAFAGFCTSIGMAAFSPSPLISCFSLRLWAKYPKMIAHTVLTTLV